ncbi:hypothetical protein F4778DRAFT_781783 [Xylariomycetidae sp. FL2044]|nr:hypothetical protein F4778DRAFT_781783 [Xylariomycetidae sp. FL2044]
MSHDNIIPLPGSHAPEDLIRAALARPRKGSIRETIQELSRVNFQLSYVSRHSQTVESLLRKAFVCLDQHFFFSSLGSRVGLGVIADVVDAGHYGLYSPEARAILIFTNVNGREQGRDCLLETLIHEMVHAYIGIFCNKTLAKSPFELETYGNHGVYFHGLNHSIINRIHQWDPVLECLVDQPWLEPTQELAMWARLCAKLILQSEPDSGDETASSLEDDMDRLGFNNL